MKTIHMKFIDYMTCAESIYLKENLIENPEPRQPFRYHEQTGHILPTENCQLQTMLNELCQYTDEHQMKLNQDKSKVILFNNAIKYDFHPKLTIEDDVQLQLVEEIRLLGVQVRSDLSCRSNTTAMCQSAYSRLWMLRRLKPLGASETELLDVYDKQIRCMLEFATPVCSSGITKAEDNQIERLQKAAFAIILGEKYCTYARALAYFGRATLSARRTDLNLKFSKKCLNSDKYQHWFKLNQPTNQLSKTRSVDDNLLVPVKGRTKGFLKSPIAYLTNLINEDSKK